MIRTISGPIPADLEGRQVKILVTLGDPAGIGPEVVYKALAALDNLDAVALTLVGNRQVWKETVKRLIDQGHQTTTDVMALSFEDIPMSAEQLATIRLGQGSEASGELSFKTLKTAIELCLREGYDGIVTAPIAKSAWLAAGYAYPGQTELLAEMAGVERFGMLFVARSPHTDWQLRTLLATTHIPLRAVPDALSPELMSLKLELLLDCLQHEFGIESPRIAIAGLNPHSGEQGQLGNEEIEWLMPWLESQRLRFPALQLDGPIPPDTLWVKPGQAWFTTGTSDYDGYLALYHDQGLIPVKLMAFDRAVNTTIGLPFIRTSPDHGTAFDIAGQGIAQADSMVAALTLAVELSGGRQDKRRMTRA